MLKVGGGADLTEEPLGADHGGELGPEQLEGDPPLVPEIVSQVHRGHAARTQLALEVIAVRQGRLESAKHIGHMAHVVEGQRKMGRAWAFGQSNG
jgi:hypothetical protein